MKHLISLSLLLAFSLNACATNSPGASVQDITSLMDTLRTEGAAVEVGETVEQAFFSAGAQILKVNGADVQVFEYESVGQMESDAAQVAPDGGTVGTTMITWIGTPHFYRTGRILVLYIGDDAATLELLEKVLGPQFAGR